MSSGSCSTCLPGLLEIVGRDLEAGLGEVCQGLGKAFCLLIRRRLIHMELSPSPGLQIPIEDTFVHERLSQPHIEELHPEQHHAHYTQHGAPLVQEPESESEGEPGWSCRSLMMEGC